MNKDYLFKTLVKAYYENRFEEAVNSLLEENQENKEQLSQVIAALCGVEIKYPNTAYAQELKKAILSYNSSQKIVTKIKGCSLECVHAGEETSCQKACHFDAIMIDNEGHTVSINNNKCIDCGFCVDACPSSCFMDKAEFIPLINCL